MSGVQVLDAPETATTGGGVAERALCGAPWDRANLAPLGELCDACERVLVERGHGHLIPFIGRTS